MHHTQLYVRIALGLLFIGPSKGDPMAGSLQTFTPGVVPITIGQKDGGTAPWARNLLQRRGPWPKRPDQHKDPQILLPRPSRRWIRETMDPDVYVVFWGPSLALQDFDLSRWFSHAHPVSHVLRA